MDRKTQNEFVRRWRESKDDNLGIQLWKEVLSRIERTIANFADKLGLTSEYEDILQDTFVVVRGKVLSGDYDPEDPASIISYSFSIVRNKLLSSYNSRKRRNEALKGYPARRGRENGSDPSVEVAKKEEIALAAKAASELPEPLKDIFCLHEGIWVCEDSVVDGPEMSFEDIGKIYGQSRAWAMEQYAKAKIILQKKVS